ncbi:MAG: ATP-binding protein [Paracoccaceae bacterium]
MRRAATIFLLAILACSAAVFWASYSYFQAQEVAKASARLSLFRSTVEAELKRFSHLPFVLARDPVLIDTIRTGDTRPLNTRLSAFADRAGIDAIYLMDRQGLTLAASNAGTEDSFVGQNYGFRPYFQTALAGQLGEFYGIGATTGIPGYFFAEPVRDANGNIVGVVAIKIDLNRLQNSWHAAGERIILANSDGVSLLASDPGWRFRTLEALSEDQRQRIAKARQFGREPLDLLAWRVDPGAGTAVIGGERFLYLHTDALPNGWQLHFFAPDDQARTQAWLTAGTLLILSALAFIVVGVQRFQRIGAALKQSEDEEAQLRAANTRLAVEIEERRAAEARLQKTQAELERAGRLAALGQLASSVTHELGQPIAAMRNHLAAAEMQNGQSRLTEKLQALADRMEGITRQLKFFSRKGRDNFERFDLRDGVREAVELVEPNVSTAEVTLTVNLPDAPVTVNANRLRIEQVLTNLLRNALDATEGTEDPSVSLTLAETPDGLHIAVADNGHGLGDHTLDELKEPFATTRESGQGMGLGLTISAGIIADHDGEMTADSPKDGGTVFHIRLPRPAGEEMT